MQANAGVLRERNSIATSAREISDINRECEKDRAIVRFTRVIERARVYVRDVSTTKTERKQTFCVENNIVLR